MSLHIYLYLKKALNDIKSDILCVKDMECSMWQKINDNVSCSCSGGWSWELLDKNLNDVSLTTDCKDLCLAQNSTGCCTIRVGTSYPGCWWQPMGTAYCLESTFGSLSFTCSKLCKVL